MVEHASQLGANAIIAVRYDATEIAAALLKYWRTARRYTWKFFGTDNRADGIN
jgi:uncharacterized protein YbjQ (UPF0145 family)